MENNEIRSVYVSRAAFIRKRTPFRERGFRGRGFRVAIFIIVRKQLTDNRFSLSNSKTIRRVFFFPFVEEVKLSKKIVPFDLLLLSKKKKKKKEKF